MEGKTKYKEETAPTLAPDSEEYLPMQSATVSMEAQSSIVVGLTDKGLQMKDSKMYGVTADQIFDQQEQAIRRFLKLKADFAAGKFNPKSEAE